MLEKITNFNPKMIKWAREQAHISIDLASAKTGLDIKEIENGCHFLNYPELRKLAELFNKPLVVFFLPEPPKIKNIETSCRTIPKSVYDELSPNTIKMINVARFMQINLYELHNNINNNIYKFHFLKDLLDSQEKIREYLKFPFEIQKKIKKDEEVFKYLRDQLNEIGIFIFKESFQDDGVSGFCLHDDVFPVIMINNNNTFTRQIFTIFHELYHLITGTSGIDFINDDYVYKQYENISTYQEELKANQFAADILISEQEIRNNIKKVEDISFDSINDVAKKYKISREVLARHLYKMKIIDFLDMEEYIYHFRLDYKRINKNKNGGNYYSNQISYLGENYLKIAYERYYQGNISSRDLTKYVRMNLKSTSILAEYKGWRTV